MFHVVSSFADAQAARRAADALVQQGFDADAIRLHSGPQAPNATAVKLDEVATGGFVHNAFNLLDGLFNTDSFRDEAASYADTVRQGGTLLSVQAADEEQVRRAQSVLEQAGGAAPKSGGAAQAPG